MICFRCWDRRERARTLNSRRGRWERRYSLAFWCDELTLRDWILHLVVDNDLHGPLITAGFLDAVNEGADVFWRLDFWNARMAAQIRRIRRWKPA